MNNTTAFCVTELIAKLNGTDSTFGDLFEDVQITRSVLQISFSLSSIIVGIYIAQKMRKGKMSLVPISVIGIQILQCMLIFSTVIAY